MEHEDRQKPSITGISNKLMDVHTPTEPINPLEYDDWFVGISDMGVFSFHMTLKSKVLKVLIYRSEENDSSVSLAKIICTGNVGQTYRDTEQFIKKQFPVWYQTRKDGKFTVENDKKLPKSYFNDLILVNFALPYDRILRKYL